MHLCAPSHLILTITHYMGAVYITLLLLLYLHYYVILFPWFYRSGNWGTGMLSNMAMVTALVSGTLGPDPAGWLWRPGLLSSLSWTGQGSPWGVCGLTFGPPFNFQMLHDSPIRCPYEGISFLQSFQILGRHTEVSCKTKISDRVFHGHSSTHSPGCEFRETHSKSTNRCRLLSWNLASRAIIHTAVRMYWDMHFPTC